ncbi:MAG: TonB-dependent receptor [Chitinophagales bacterium]|nr:TonB-dependent receptor [Chitinophagales bacterium]
MQQINLLRISLYTVVFVFCYSKISGQDKDSLNAYPLQEVIVTATTTAKDVNATGREVTVITREELQQSGAKTLSSLLSGYTGISVIGSGQNPGMTQTVFMRGTAGNQVVIMIDGIPVSDPSSTNNALDLNELPLSNVEQIEIVRGSHSTLYGSSAVGGAINIITRGKQTTGFHVGAAVNGGIFGSQTSLLEENIFVGYTFSNGIYVNIDGYNNHVNGLDATIDTSTVSADFRSFDRDDFSQQKIGAKLGYAHNDVDVAVAYNFTNAAADYDKAGFKFRSPDVPTTLYDGDSTRIFTQRNFVSCNATYRFNKQFDMQFDGGYSFLHRTSVDDSSLIDAAGTSDHTYANGLYEGAELNNEVLGHYKWKYLMLTAGTGISYETMTSATHYFNSAYAFELVSDLDTLNLHASIFNLFVQTDIDGRLFSPSLKKLNIVAGARYNKHDLYGSTLVYEINPSYLIGQHARLYASYSTGFNAPSLYQLYAPDVYYTSDITRGNPTLQAEYARSVELGIKFFPGKQISCGASFYTSSVQHSIEYVYLWDKNVPVGELGQDFYRDDFRGDTYINAGTQHSWGAAAYCSFPIRKWLMLDANISLMKGNLTYDAAELDTVHTEGNHVQLYSNGAFPVSMVETDGLVRRPSTANLGITLTLLRNATIRLSGRWTGSYNDIYYDYALGPFGALNAVPLKGYFLTDLLMRYRLNEHFGASLKVENLFNTTYTEIRGFTTKGIGMYISLNASF